jgi:hypothetical protein
MKHLTAEQLQHLLREFGGGLADVEVEPVSPLLPGEVDILGTVMIHGKPLTYHIERFPLERIQDHNGVLKLAGQLLESFEQASARPPATT